MSTLAALPLLLAVASASDLSVEGDLREGRPVALRLAQDGAPRAGVALRADYRQNANKRLQHSQSLGATGADGRLQWTPEEPGVVVLAWEGGSLNVSVLHDGVPLRGVLVALLAGLLLLGGSIFFFLQMMRRRE